MLHPRLILCFLLASLDPRLAAAETERPIVSSRVSLGDLLPNAPTELANLDLGPAPPAGSSRLYSIGDLVAAARAAGHTLVVKDSVRAVRATQHFSQTELSAMLTPKIEAALPGYAKLVRVDFPRALVTPAGVELNHIVFGQLPNRRGTVHTSVVAELSVEGKIERRLSLRVVVELEERPKPIEIERGTLVTLVINLGATKVSAAAMSVHSVAVGSSGLFRVRKTQKTLRAKLISRSAAEVVSE